MNQCRGTVVQQVCDAVRSSALSRHFHCESNSSSSESFCSKQRRREKLRSFVDRDESAIDEERCAVLPNKQQKQSPPRATRFVTHLAQHRLPRNVSQLTRQRRQSIQEWNEPAPLSPLSQLQANVTLGNCHPSMTLTYSGCLNEHCKCSHKVFGDHDRLQRSREAVGLNLTGSRSSDGDIARTSLRNDGNDGDYGGAQRTAVFKKEFSRKSNINVPSGSRFTTVDDQNFLPKRVLANLVAYWLSLKYEQTIMNQSHQSRWLINDICLPPDTFVPAYLRNGIFMKQILSDIYWSSGTSALDHVSAVQITESIGTYSSPHLLQRSLEEFINVIGAAAIQTYLEQHTSWNELLQRFRCMLSRRRGTVGEILRTMSTTAAL